MLETGSWAQTKEVKEMLEAQAKMPLVKAMVKLKADPGAIPAAEEEEAYAAFEETERLIASFSGLVTRRASLADP